VQKKLVVAKKITIDEIPTAQLSGAFKEINDLISYLYCFLDSNAYPGNKPQSTKVIHKMLTHAHLSNDILSFSFPKKIRLQFCLQKKYCLTVNKKNTAFDFFIDSLLPQSKLACTISIAAIGIERRLALQRIQKIVLDSKEHLQSVSVQKQQNGYITILKFRLTDIPDKTTTAQKTIILAVYELQEILSPD